jgi:DNA polymerase V
MINNSLSPREIQIVGHSAVCGTELSLPLFASTVSAGFPSPADDYIETALDLNEFLIKRPAATFFVRVSGQSMIGAGINPGDILIVDRSLTPKNNSIVIAVLNGELTVKRILLDAHKIKLMPENSDFPTIEIQEGMDFTVWGVVTTVIHSLT